MYLQLTIRWSRLKIIINDFTEYIFRDGLREIWCNIQMCATYTDGFKLLISSALSNKIRLKELAACAVEISLKPPVDSVRNEVY